MSVLIEDYLPVVKHQGLNTAKNIVTTGTITASNIATTTDTFTVAATFDDTVTVTGVLTASNNAVVEGTLIARGALSSPRPIVTGVDATYALGTDDSGTVFIATKGSATQTYTLPAVGTSEPGLYYTFICGHASGEILITPQAGEAIKIVSFAAVGADADTAIVAPAAGTGIKNTAATNAITDNITLVSDGTQWLSLGIAAGIWASQ